MDIITGPESLRYIDQQLRRFQESGRLFREAAFSSSALVQGKESNPVESPHLEVSIDQKSPEDDIPQRRAALNSDQQPHSRQTSLSRSPEPGEWSDSRSECSVASSSTTLSDAAFKAHEQSQFAKLLPHKDAGNQGLQKSGKKSVFSNLRKSLKRKLPILDLNGAANVVSTSGIDKSPEEDFYEELSNEIPAKSSVPTIKAPIKKQVDQHLRNEEARSDLREARPQRRAVPQGRRLAEVQLALQENILSDIADQAIENSRRRSKGGKAKRQSDPTGEEEEPEDLDRELEVTRDLMKQLRKALNDGYYRDMYLLDSKGQEESMAGKYAILCDILRMLRRAFRDILARYERAYRPTGFVVVDQEMVKEMDEQLLARENLIRRYPTMTVEEMLETLGRIGHVADLKTLAGL